MTFAFRVAIVAGVSLICAIAMHGAAQTPAPPILQEPKTILLWPNGAPGAQGDEDADKPAITVYMPPNTSGRMPAVIIAPGGSYAHLSMNLEGRAPANHLNSLGMAAFVVWAGKQTWDWTQRMTIPKTAACFALGWLALVVLATQEYNPFIYFIF